MDYSLRNVPQDHIADISPTEFEILVKDWLVEAGQGLCNLEVLHNVKDVAYDGTYQIDVKATFEVFKGSNIIFLVECKKYTSPVKREKVEILYNRVQSLGAHKGMIVSASGFQQGAYEFANKHGIALVRLYEGNLEYLVKSQEYNEILIPAWARGPKYIGTHIYIKDEITVAFANLQPKCLETLSEFIFGNSITQ